VLEPAEVAGLQTALVSTDNVGKFISANSGASLPAGSVLLGSCQRQRYVEQLNV